ncbi:GNAT family N-acetyltransferase [Sciscionella marina]|uniref:GNAT family N-acetyltransferase n=1 Tax=Sciscionella marina TaxID=508770 RepID=UPI000369D6AD|nr:GNAT family N-acetyltransferase [Sciscionella marina]
MPPPERIELPGRVLLRARPAHAEQTAQAVAASMDELMEWMPWAGPEAAKPENQRVRFTEADATWDSGEVLEFVLFDAEERALLGVLGLHRRIGPGAIELGYWSHSAYAGKGNITAAAGALTETALAMPDIQRVEIHCDAANHASAAIPRKLGYRQVRTEDRAPQARAETGKHQIWVRP